MLDISETNLIPLVDSPNPTSERMVVLPSSTTTSVIPGQFLLFHASERSKVGGRLSITLISITSLGVVSEVGERGALFDW